MFFIWNLCNFIL